MEGNEEFEKIYNEIINKHQNELEEVFNSSMKEKKIRESILSKFSIILIISGALMVFLFIFFGKYYKGLFIGYAIFI